VCASPVHSASRHSTCKLFAEFEQSSLEWQPQVSPHTGGGMQDGETSAVSVAAALKASKVANCSFRMLRSAAVGGYEAATRLLGCLLTRQSQLRPLIECVYVLTSSQMKSTLRPAGP